MELEKSPEGKRYEAMFAVVEEMFAGELEGMKLLEGEMRARMAAVMGDPENQTRRAGATPLTFMSNMYENLISLRQARLAAVKDIAQMKKMGVDVQMKADKGEGDEEAFMKTARALMEILAEDGRSGKMRIMLPVPDDAMLAELDLAAEAAAASEGAPDPREANAASAERMVVDRSTGGILRVNADYQIIEEVDEPERFQVIRNKKEMVVSAIDNVTGEKLEVVET